MDGVRFLAVALLALTACRAENPVVPTIAEMVDHRVEFVIPDGWQHMDHGRKQHFERGMAHLALEDLGPATPEGFAETLREARSLFRDHQWEDARALLDGTDPRRFFADEARWKEVAPHWKMIRHIRRREGWSEDKIGAGGISRSTVWEVESAYHDLLVAVGSLSPLDLDTLARRALDRPRPDALRDVAREEATSISGRPALLIETWDRLSHGSQRLFLFILSEGRLLRLETQLGRFSELEPAFESLRASLSIEALQGDDAAGV